MKDEKNDIFDFKNLNNYHNEINDEMYDHDTKQNFNVYDNQFDNYNYNDTDVNFVILIQNINSEY